MSLLKFIFLFIFLLFFTLSTASASSFQYVGVNMHSLMKVDNTNLANSLDYLSRQCGVNVVRIFGTSDRGGVPELQRVAAFATANNIQLIVALADFSNGSPEITINGDPTPWFQQGYKTAYLPYVKTVTQALKDTPGILALELGNEPHCRGYTQCIPAYNAWAKDVSEEVKAIDPNRKVSIGQMASSGPNGLDYFVESNTWSSIDLTSAHYYDETPPNQKQAAANALTLAKAPLNKPFYIGEAGYPDTSNRPTLVRTDMNEFRNNGAIGYLYWQYSGNRNIIETAQFSDPYSFFEGDPLCGILKEGRSSYLPSYPSWWNSIPENLRNFLEQLYLFVFFFMRPSNLDYLLDGVFPTPTP